MSPFKKCAAGSDDCRFPSYDKHANGVIDFAGSGVVHMVGGFAGLVGAVMVGPRKGRFENGIVKDIVGHNITMCALGTMTLWFGWYGFNGGSTLCVAGCAELAGQVFVSTTMSAATAGLTGTAITKAVDGHYNISVCLNSILAGLVSVTAGCAVVTAQGASICGLIGAVIYISSAKVLLRFEIDDPLEAFPVHGMCGLWGVLAAGILSSDERIFNAYRHGTDEVYDAKVYTAVKSGEQFLAQLVAVGAIALWTLVMSFLVFKLVDKKIGLRVDHYVEDGGLDIEISVGGRGGLRHRDSTVQHNNIFG